MTPVKAIVFPEPNRAEIQHYDLPELRPGEMLVRTEFSGVSQGTETWAFTGRRPEIQFPTVPGYQAVGTIEEVGADISGFEPGQRVFFQRSRLPELFPPTWMGSHVSRAIVTPDVALVVPEKVSSEAAALSALSAVSYRGIKMLEIGIGDLVVVIGQGLIGQGSAQLARLRGATVIATDLSETRLDLSRRCSADIAINPQKEDLTRLVRSIKPEGADVIIETTGRSDVFALCIDLLGILGQILLQGWYPDPISFDFHTTHLKRPTIAVTCGYDLEAIRTCLDLMSYGKLDFDGLITHEVPCDEAPKMYPRFAAGDSQILGTVFNWRESE
ncbi:MAG: alcohol dehydrogenase [Armatimonadota bacterium]|nr:MAG: alcohol dehydrogenase [Armatimonadota bacterium]